VRLAAKLTMAVAPFGLLLLLDGLLELHWFGTTEAHQLAALMDKIQADYGIEPAALLRGRLGALQDVILGLVCLGYAALGIWVLRGRLWARTWALILGVLATLAGVIGIGADSTEPRTLAAYFNDLLGSELTDRVPMVHGLLYPGWYPWVEDIVQGLQVIGSVAALLALAWAVITHSDYFTGNRDVGAAPDDWDNALARVKEQSRKQREAES